MLQGTRRLRGNERILTEPHAAFWNPAVYDNWVVPVNAIGNLLREDGCHAPLRSAEALLALDELAILRVVGGILAPQRRNDTKRRLQSQMFYLFYLRDVVPQLVESLMSAQLTQAGHV
jgi:hypothetical protein